MTILDDLLEKFRKASFPNDEQVVVYAGEDPWDDIRGNEFEFGAFVPVSRTRAEWLPFVANDPEVIAQLQSLEIGQAFKILEEESCGPMGMRVLKIALEPSLPKYAVGADNPATLQL